MAGQGLGQGSLGLSPKISSSGAPFTPGSADNGLSVDPVTGRIVWGQAPGEPGNPGAVISNRQIPFASGTEMNWLDSLGRPMFFINEPFNVISMGFDLNGTANPRLVMQPGPVIFQITSTNLLFADVFKWTITLGLPARSGTSSVLVHNHAGGGTDGDVQEIIGASGNFTTVDLKTVTVLDGVITSIV